MYFPIFLDLKGRPCLVIGGGKIALFKVRKLLSAQAQVTIIAETICPSLSRLQHRTTIIKRKVKLSDVHKGYFLIYSAIDNPPLNPKIYHKANRLNILLNSVDNTAASSFISAATVTQGLLHIAVSTSGASPLLASAIKSGLAALYGKEYRIFLDYLARLRPIVTQSGLSMPQKKEIFKKMIASNALSLIKQSLKSGKSTKKEKAYTLLKRIAHES